MTAGGDTIAATYAYLVASGMKSDEAARYTQAAFGAARNVTDLKGLSASERCIADGGEALPGLIAAILGAGQPVLPQALPTIEE